MGSRFRVCVWVLVFWVLDSGFGDLGLVVSGFGDMQTTAFISHNVSINGFSLYLTQCIN